MKDEYKFKVKNIKRYNDMATSLENTIDDLRQLKNDARSEERRVFNRLARVCEYNCNTVCGHKKARVGVCMLDDCALVWETN